jgi:serine/threonine protein kinase
MQKYNPFFITVSNLPKQHTIFPLAPIHFLSSIINISCRGYTAPEYIDSGEMSLKYDVYSLGVIIIELVTGSRSIPDINNVSVFYIVDGPFLTDLAEILLLHIIKRSGMPHLNKFIADGYLAHGFESFVLLCCKVVFPAFGTGTPGPKPFYFIHLVNFFNMCKITDLIWTNLVNNRIYFFQVTLRSIICSQRGKGNSNPAPQNLF